MSWFSDRLFFGRLRTGPTVLLPAEASHPVLLEMLRLVDPGACSDGDDIMVTGVRVTAGVELAEPELRKLNIDGEKRLWAHRIVSDGPLPVNGFDRGLAEGIAYRLGGWSMTRGLMSDPAEDDHRGPIAYLGEMPSPEEMASLLRRHLRPADSVKQSWQQAGPAELDDGVVHLIREDLQMYGGADILVSAVHENEIPPAVYAVMPYATQLVKVDVRPFEDADGTTLLSGDEAMLQTGAVALAIVESFRGQATDGWGFQISEPGDLLPGGYRDPAEDPDLTEEPDITDDSAAEV
ncbi:hypothetical protein [Streptosporangium lutulentum]|uniref:DUF4261 domain-containing protein n=1 Tax=Streptosporangium lutulentum TaxID=1461250 RepID=A0ABT9QFA2_9ACTN|nr:hypothetical protein [Streptosporangium lutulentum]MDP9845456.1 hypothetical protein [Streptosporangium lutulentum]